jgi:hypothetical protein
MVIDESIDGTTPRTWDWSCSRSSGRPASDVNPDVRSCVQVIDDERNPAQSLDEPEPGPPAAPRVLIVSSSDREDAGRMEHRVPAPHCADRARFGGKRERIGRSQTGD